MVVLNGGLCDRWVSQPGLQEQHLGGFSAPARVGGDLAGDIWDLKRNCLPMLTWQSLISMGRARDVAVHPSVCPCARSSSSRPGARWPLGSAVLGKVSADITLWIFYFFLGYLYRVARTKKPIVANSRLLVWHP